MTTEVSFLPGASTEQIAYWPRLTWFYGLSPDEIAGMPYAVIRLYLDRIPSLQAEDQLLAMEAAGFPYFEDKDRQKIHRDYVRDLEVRKPEAAELPSALALAGMGIGVKRKEKKAASDA